MLKLVVSNELGDAIWCLYLRMVIHSLGLLSVNNDIVVGTLTSTSYAKAMRTPKVKGN
jgi:hypothetical protein